MGARYSFQLYASERLNSLVFSLQVIVNLLGSSLVGSKEGEATLSTAYQTHQKSSPVQFYILCVHNHSSQFLLQHTDIPHILWDYHALGGHKNIDKLDAKVTFRKLFCIDEMLIGQIQLGKYVDKMEFFHKAGPTVTKTQTGVVR